MNLFLALTAVTCAAMFLIDYRIGKVAASPAKTIWFLWGALVFGTPVFLLMQSMTNVLPEGTIDWVILAGNLGLALFLFRGEVSLTVTSQLTILLVAISLIFGLFTASFLAPLVAGLNCLPVLMLGRKQLTLENFKTAALGAIVVGFLGLGVQFSLNPGWVGASCRLDKCSIFGTALVNQSAGNGLGVYVAFLTVLGISLTTSRIRQLVIFLCGLLISDLAGSRSAIAGLVAAALVVLVKPLLARRAKVIQFVIVIVATAGALIPVTNLQEADFTLRASLWRAAIHDIIASPIIGYGPSAWVRQGVVGTVFANYSTHNIWLENAYALGMVGAVLFAILLLGFGLNWAHSQAYFLFAVSIYVLVLGTLEVPLGFTRPYLLPAGLTFFLLLQQLIRNNPEVASGPATSVGSRLHAR